MLSPDSIGMQKDFSSSKSDAGESNSIQEQVETFVDGVIQSALYRIYGTLADTPCLAYPLCPEESGPTSDQAAASNADSLLHNPYGNIIEDMLPHQSGVGAATTDQALSELITRQILEMGYTKLNLPWPPSDETVFASATSNKTAGSAAGEHAGVFDVNGLDREEALDKLPNGQLQSLLYQQRSVKAHSLFSGWPQPALSDTLDFSAPWLKAKEISWPSIGEFTVERGEDCLHRFVQTWNLHLAWLYCIDVLELEEQEFEFVQHYRVRCSLPTRRRPVPKVTVCIFFRVRLSKVKPKDHIVKVDYVIEGNQLVHRPGETAFSEKWLKDVADSKSRLMKFCSF